MKQKLTKPENLIKIPEPRTERLTVSVIAPHGMTNERIAELLQKLIDVGMADANDTLRDEDETNEDARDVVSLDVSVDNLGKSGQLFNFSLTDDEAARAGKLLANDFRLKQSREHKDWYETENGSFTALGIARRALRIISEGI